MISTPFMIDSAARTAASKPPTDRHAAHMARSSCERLSAWPRRFGAVCSFRCLHSHTETGIGNEILACSAWSTRPSTTAPGTRSCCNKRLDSRFALVVGYVGGHPAPPTHTSSRYTSTYSYTYTEISVDTGIDTDAYTSSCACADAMHVLTHL